MMYYIYTFTIYLIILTRILICESFLLDLGRTGSYSNRGVKVVVQKVENLYNHRFENPVFLKEVYNGGDKIYFDSLLTNVQRTVSVSVLWDSNEPIVVQMNLEKSSVVLLNDDSHLKVQAIFSNKGVTNISPKRHLSSDLAINVKLSEYEDYVLKTNYKLPVTSFSFSDPKLKNYSLIYYNLESERLDTITYKTKALSTIDQTKVSGSESKDTAEVPLEIPYKEEVYGIYSYTYDGFPLLIEVVYTFSKRIFYGNTPDKKWHRVYLPSIEDPTYVDYLVNLLDYYSCVNGYKFTVDLGFSSKTKSTYKIENYCMGPQGVETIENELTVEPLNDVPGYEYKGYNHSPSKTINVYLRHLVLDGKYLQLPQMPPLVKYIQVYHENNKPIAVGLFNSENEAVTYKLIKGKWKKYVGIVKFIYGQYRFSVDNDPVDLLPPTAKIAIIESAQHDLKTIRKDRLLNSIRPYELTNYDVWYYNNYDFATVLKGGTNYFTASTKDYVGINRVYYYNHRLIDFREFKTKILVHIVRYLYDYKNDCKYVDIYTNVLYNYCFKLNYYNDNHWEWVLVHKKPVEIVGDGRNKTSESESLKLYFQKTENFDFENQNLPDEVAKLMPESVKIKISKVELQEINTINGNSRLRAEKKFVEGYFDVWYYNDSYTWHHYVDFNGNLDDWMVVRTKNNVGLNRILYFTYDIKDFRKKGIHVHRLEYSYNGSNYFMTVRLYTDTLYVYCFRINYYDYTYKWKLLYKKPANVVDVENPERLESYYEMTWNVEDFTKKIKQR